MIYLLLYFSIGLAVSLLTAMVHARQGLPSDDALSKDRMMDVFLFIALAWPVTLVAFFCGACTQIWTHLSAGRSH